MSYIEMFHIRKVVDAYAYNRLSAYWSIIASLSRDY